MEYINQAVRVLTNRDPSIHTKKPSLSDYDFNEEQKMEISRIFREKEKEGTEQMISNRNIFILKQAPQYVFKDFGSVTENHYEQVHQVAKRICFDHQFDLLVLPKSALININGKFYIVEECLHIYHHNECQEYLYYQFSEHLTETMRQLAIFITKMHTDDVVPRNFPILNTNSMPPKIGLIDPECTNANRVKCIANGFFGGFNGSCGLINCATSSDQIDAIFSVMKSEGVTQNAEIVEFCKNNHTDVETYLQELKCRRLESLKWYEGIKEYYSKKQFVTGKEPIEVDMRSLGLSLAEEGMYFKNGKVIPTQQVLNKEWEESWLGALWLKATRSEKTKIEKSEGFYQYYKVDAGQLELLQLKITMEDIVKEFLAAINKFIADQPNNRSIYGTRSIQMHDAYGDTGDVFNRYKNIGRDRSNHEDYQESIWMFRILNSLVDNGYIFKYTYRHPHLYIQA